VGEWDPDEQNDYNDDEEFATTKPKRSAKQIAYQFKPGVSGNPNGRPKGTISLTNKLHKLLRLPVQVDGKPIDDEHTYGDLLVEIAIKAAGNGNYKFFKELFDRTDGKVPDHIVLENTKRLVSQQAGTIAQGLIVMVEDVASELLDDDMAEKFMVALGEKVAAKFSDDDEDDDSDAEAEAVAIVTKRKTKPPDENPDDELEILPDDAVPSDDDSLDDDPTIRED